jgi:transcriptional regulator with XRE-family HTH domain
MKGLLKDPGFRHEISALDTEFAVARQIIEFRIKAKLTQSELAKRAHTSQVVISRLENGQANPSIDMLKRVSKALGKNIEVVLK